jgi:hypothetical protein
LFDDLALGKHLLLAPKEYIGGRDIIERFVIALVVVIRHKIRNGLLQLPGKVEGVEQNDRFHRTVITLDLALGLGMVRTSMNLLDVIGALCARMAATTLLSLPSPFPYSLLTLLGD